jgi:hypothetical protein
MKGYLDNLNIKDVESFKVFLILQISLRKSWLAHIDVSEKFYGRTIDFFISEVLTHWQKGRVV